MCYAFTARMQAEALPVAVEEGRAEIIHEKASTVQSEAKDASQSRKRSASSSLEHGHAKVAKSLDGDAKSRAASVVSATDAGGEKAKSYEELAKEHETVKQRANKLIRELKAEKKGVEDERDELRGINAELRDDLEHAQEKLKSKGSDSSSKQIAKRVEDDIKNKYGKKLREMQAKSEQIWSQKLASREKALQRKIDDLRERKEDAEKDAKQAKADFLQQEKARKLEHDELKKELRAEKQAEIKKFREDNSSEVKEKKDLIKSYQNQIEGIKKDTKVAGNEMGELQYEVKKLREYKRDACHRIKALGANIQEKTDFTFSLGREYAAKTQELEAKLAFEAKRWQKQKDCCDELKQKLMAQQRENFVLRNSSQGGAEKLEALMERMKKMREGGTSGETARTEAGGDRDAAGRPQSGAVAGPKTGDDVSRADVEQDEGMLGLLAADGGMPETAGDSIFGTKIASPTADETTAGSSAGHDDRSAKERVDSPAAENVSHPSPDAILPDAAPSSSSKAQDSAMTSMLIENADSSTGGSAFSTQGELESSTAAVTEGGAMATSDQRDYGSGWLAMSAQAADEDMARAERNDASASKSRRV